MIVELLLASLTPALERCAVRAVEAMTESWRYRLTVVRRKGVLGQVLDAGLTALPSDAEWLFTMHDDSVPLRPGWLPWLLEQIGEKPCGGFYAGRRGVPHWLGAAYRVPWLRAKGFSFRMRTDGREFYDIGETVMMSVGRRERPFIATQAPQERPTWLRGLMAAVDDDGRLIWGHLGGGTIGATSPRISVEQWIEAVDQHVEAMTTHDVPAR